MAVGEIRSNPDTGQFIQLTANGWQPISPDAVAEAKGQGALGAMGQALVGAEQPAVAAAYPGASMTGQAAGFALPFMVAGPAGAEGAAALRARAAARAVERGMVGSRAEAAMGAAIPGGTAAPAAAEAMATRGAAGLADSAGAMRADVPQGPLAERAGRWFSDMIGGETMTADQLAIQPAGERLGMITLPGMESRAGSPGRQLMASAMSRPDVRYAIQPVLEHNVGRVEQAAMRALGTDAEFGMRGIGQGMGQLKQRFNAIQASVPERPVLPEELVASLKELGGISNEFKPLLAEDGSLSASDLFSLRSDLNLMASDLSSAPGMRMKGNRFGQAARQLDDFINSQLPNTEARQEWKKTREQWLVSVLLRKKGLVQPDGSISWKTARGVLDSELPDAFRLQLEGARNRLEPATRDFMDAVDFANAFGDLVPDSGTATRLGLDKLNAKDYLIGQAARHVVRGHIDRAEAASLARQASQRAAGATPP